MLSNNHTADNFARKVQNYAMSLNAMDDNEAFLKDGSISSTDRTDLSSESDGSSCDDSSSASLPLHASKPSGKKSVRFSLVHTREYDVVEDPASVDDDEEEGPRTTLSWEFREKESSDIETHQEDMKKERKEKYLTMIREHINRVEIKREEETNRQRLKKKGIKSKVLKPLWKGLLEVGSRSALVMPSTPYQ